MTSISYLIQKILMQHVDRETNIPEVILIGYVDNNVVEEHLARYLIAQRFSRGIVLDIASGTGYGSSILARAEKSIYVISVDINYDLLRYGAKVFNINGVQADALKLPFRDGALDTVVTLETIEHLPDPISFIKEISRVLKFDGLVVLSTPNKLYSSPFVKKPLNPYHIKEFYLGELEFVLKQGGLEPCYVLCGKPFTKLALIRRVIGTMTKSNP